jgi:pilus assembly protein CpaB
MERDSVEFRKRILFVVAIASGILGILLLNVYLTGREKVIKDKLDEIKRQQEHAAAAVKKTISVLVARRDIPAEIPITSSDLATKEIPEDYLQPGAIPTSAANKAIGMVAASPITAGEQILDSKLNPPSERPKILSEITPMGKRAVSVSVDNISNLAGLLQPGDYVDVLTIISPPAGSSLYSLALDAASMPSAQQEKVITLPLFQNILVLAVGTDLSSSESQATKGKSKEKAKSSGGAVTLSLSPQEAAMISFVQEQGKIRLLMRSNSDIGQTPVKAVNWDALFDYLYPEVKARGMKITNTVEIYRGLNKEVVPLAEGKKQ